MLMEGYIHVGFLMLWLLGKIIKRPESELYKHVLPASLPPTLEHVLSRPARKDADHPGRFPIRSTTRAHTHCE